MEKCLLLYHYAIKYILILVVISHWASEAVSVSTLFWGKAAMVANSGNGISLGVVKGYDVLPPHECWAIDNNV